MSGARLSEATRALLRAARSDAPGAVTRAKVWSGVSAVVGSTAGAGGAGASASARAGLSAAKMLAIGTLLGGAITVGLASLLLYAAPARGGKASPAAAPSGVAAAAPVPGSLGLAPAPASPASPAAIGEGARAPANLGARVGIPAAPRPPAAPPRPTVPARGQLAPRPGGAAHANPDAPADDALTREASRIAEARSLLARGDATAALRMVRSARATPSPQLIPEELTVEAQALRALGQADDARGIDATLRTRYPDSTLSR